MCGKKLGDSISDEYAQDIVQKFYDQYGARAKQAQKNEAVDWKALSHGLRACFQLEELYETGSIQFPLKSAEYLKEVKKGIWRYDAVSEALEEHLSKISELSEQSEYPSTVDAEFWNSWLLKELSTFFN